MADALHLSLLDGFAADAGTQRLNITGTRSCQVLAYLALNTGRVVSFAQLSEALWGDAPPASERNSIQRFVSDLRRDLGDCRSRIESWDHGYSLNLGPDDSCDVVELNAVLPLAASALADGRAGEALSLIDSAAAHRGQPLQGLESANFVLVEQLRLAELLADCGELQAQACLAKGDAHGALRGAQRLLEICPYREGLCVVVATALTRLGRANEALNAVARFRATLQHDLGLEVSPVVERLELDILLHKDAPRSEPMHRTQPRSLRPAGGAASDTSMSKMFGHGELIGDCLDLLASERVVTLIGTGGIGKTAAAAAVVDSWQREGFGIARFISFDGVSAAGVAAAVGQAVGTSTKNGVDPLGEAVDRICAEVNLLVLDNCEHLAAEVGELVDKILIGSAVRVVVTSRCPLQKVYEHLLLVEPLSYESSREFLHHQLRRSAVDLDVIESELLDELLTELDGLPLAIEVAAANLRSIGIRELLARWRETDTLPATLNGRPSRHTSVASALRTSIDGLDKGTVEILRQCALFPSDFDLAALEAVTGGDSALVELDRLVHHSLLVVRHGAAGTRYRMLVPVRAEVRRRHDTTPTEWIDRMIEYHAKSARTSLEMMKRNEPARGVAKMRADLANIVFAFDHAELAGDVSSMAEIVAAVGLANGLCPSIGARGHLQEWGERLRGLPSAAAPDPSEAADVWTAAAWGLYGSGNGEWYRRWEAETSVGDPECQAMAAIARFSLGKSAEAWELLEPLALDEVTDPFMRALLCGIGAVIAFEVGVEAGHELTAVAVAAANEQPSPGAAFFATLAQATQAFIYGDFAATIAMLDAAVEAIDGHGLITLENMGRAAIAMTSGTLLRDREPGPVLCELLGRYLDQHSLDPASVAMGLDSAALCLDRAGKTSDAARLVGLLERMGLSMAILRPARVELSEKINSEPAWVTARAEGAVRTTFDVLASTQVALADVSLPSPTASRTG